MGTYSVQKKIGEDRRKGNNVLCTKIIQFVLDAMKAATLTQTPPNAIPFFQNTLLRFSAIRFSLYLAFLIERGQWLLLGFIRPVTDIKGVSVAEFTVWLHLQDLEKLAHPPAPLQARPQISPNAPSF